MTTNRRQFNQKGYSRLAFILLIVAMCFTAFIAIPFGNTQASAYTYNKSYVQVSTNHVRVNNTDYWHEVDLFNGGGVFFGLDDKVGIQNIDSHAHADRNIPQKAENFKGLQFAKNYYDFNNGQHTSLTTGKLTFDSFKNDTVQEVALNDLDTMFGVGTGFYGWHSGQNGMNVRTTLSPDKLCYHMDGWLQGRSGSNDSKQWRINNGLMYTFIQIPADIAPYISVSASANIGTKAVIGEVYFQGLGSPYRPDCKFIPVMDMQVGTKPNTDAKDLGFNKVSNAQVTGNGTDSADEKVVRTTGEVDMNGNTWIKLVIGVMSNDTNSLNGRTNQEWNNYLNVSNVKLTFRLKAPNIHTSLNLETSNYINGTTAKRVASFEVAIDKKILGSNHVEHFLNPTGNTSLTIKLIDTTRCSNDNDTANMKEITLTDNDKVNGSWYDTKVVDSGNYKIYTFKFYITQNGKYRVRLYDRYKYKNLQESSTSLTQDASESNIDAGAPQLPKSDLAGKWFTNSAESFNISNLVDTIDEKNNRNGASAAGVDKLNVYLKKIGDDETVTNPNSLIAGSKSATYDLSSGSVSTKNIKLVDLYSNFFTDKSANWGYGRYVVFYNVTDKAGNASEYKVDYFNYENNAEYSFNDIKVYTNKWLTSTEFNQVSNWVTTDKIVIKFNFNDTDFHFPVKFDIITGNDGFEFCNFIKKTASNGSELPSGVTVEEGYYYAVVDLNKIPKINLNFHIDKLYVNGYKLGKPTQFNTTELRLQVDTQKPFDKLNELPMLDANTLEGLKNGWYTFRDNNKFLSSVDNSFKLPRKDKGGMYFFVNCDKESMSDYYDNYTFTVKGTNVKVEAQSYQGYILVFVPLTNQANNKLVLDITDQAGNLTTINLPNIQYDDREYKVGNMKVFHFEKLFNDYIEINETTDLTDNIETRLEEKDLASIVNRIYARGEKLTIKVNQVPQYQDFKYVGMTIKSADGTLNQTFEDASAPKTDFVFGETVDSKYEQVNIDLLVNKYINIDIYAKDLPLTNDINTTPKYRYDATDMDFTIKDVNGGSPIIRGIVSDNYVDNVWTGIKNFVNGGNKLSVSIKNDVDRIYTREAKTVIVNIIRRDVDVNIKGNFNFEDIDGFKVITQQFGEPINIDFDLITGTSDVLDMEFAVEGTGDNITGSIRNLTFKSKTDNPVADNYNFNFKINQQDVVLKIKIVPRTITIELSDVPDIIYGSNDAEIENALKAVKKAVIDGLQLKDGSTLQIGNILGNLKLVISEQDKTPISVKTPVNDINHPYYIDLSNLYVEGNKGNFIIKADNKTNKFNIVKRNITLNIDSKYNSIEYGNVPQNFLDANIVSFDNMVSGDSISEITALISYSINHNGALATKTNNYYDAKTGYSLQFKVNGKHNNYNVIANKFDFNIIPRTINFGIDLSKATTGKEYNGKSLVGVNGDFDDYSKVFPYDINEIKKQFLVASDFDKYNFTGANNAFYIDGEVINVNLNGYTIKAVADFDTKVTTTLNRNYKFVPVCNITTFTISPKTVDATITSFVDANGQNTDFTKLFRYFGQGFTSAITEFKFEVMGAVESDKANFKVAVNNGSSYVDAVTFANDINSAAGSHDIMVYYAPDKQDIRLNYLINQKAVVLNILKALYTLEAKDFEGLKLAVDTALNNVIYTGNSFTYNKVITFTTADGKVIEFKLYTKEQYINVGTGYNIFIDTTTATVDKNADYSGVNFNGKDHYTFAIKPFIITEKNFGTITLNKVYDGTTAFNQTVTLVGTPDNVVMTISGTLDNADAGNRNANITRTISNANYKLGAGLGSAQAQVEVAKKDATIQYNGKTSFVKDATNAKFNVNDFVVNGIVEKDKATLNKDLKRDNDLAIDSEFSSLNDGGIITVKYTNTNYNVANIKITIHFIDANVVIVDIAIKENISNLIYDGKVFNPTFNLTGNVEIPADVEVTTDINSPIKDAGTYTFTAKIDKVVNGKTYYGEKTFTVVIKPVVIDVQNEIAKKTITISVDNKDFDGTTNAKLNITSNNFGVVAGENVEVELKDVVSNFENIIGKSNVAYATKLKFGQGITQSNYEIVNASGVVEGTINKKAIDFVVSDTIVYGQPLTITPNGVVEGFDVTLGVSGIDTYTPVGTPTATFTFDNTNKYYTLGSIKGVSGKVATPNTLSITINKRPVSVSVNDMEVSAGTTAESIKIPAIFEKTNGNRGYFDKDYAEFSAISFDIYNISNTGALSVGKYQIVPKVSIPTLKNYSLEINPETKFIIVRGTKVKVSFVGSNIVYVYGNVKDNNAIIDALLKTIKFTDFENKVVFDGATATPEQIASLKEKISFLFDGASIFQENKNISDLTKANADTYTIKINYNSNVAEQDFIFNSYDANNLKVQINKRKVKFEFKPNFFSYNMVDGKYETCFFYGDDLFTDALLNEMLQVVDNEDSTGTVINGFISSKTSISDKGGLKFNTPSYSSIGLYNAGEYTLDFKDLWFSASKSSTNFENYEYTVPADNLNRKIVIKPKEVKLEVKYRIGDSLVDSFEFDSNLPSFASDWVVSVKGEVSYNNKFDYFDFEKINLNRENDNIFNAGAYNFLLEIVDKDDNYFVSMNGKYVNVVNKFNITKRQVVVDSLSFNDNKFDKVFDNNSNLVNPKYSVRYLNDGTVIKAENGENKINAESLFAINAGYYNNGLAEVNALNNLDIKYILSLKDESNYEIVKGNVAVNGDTTITVEGGSSVVYTGKGNITPANLQINVKYDKDGIATLLDNDTITKVYDSQTKLNVSYDFIVSDVLSSLINGRIVNANFNDKNVDKANKVTLSLGFTSDIKNIYSNINIYLNGTDEAHKIKFNNVGNVYTFNIDYTGATITPCNVVATEDSYITKIYDGTNSIYYTPSVQPDSTGKYIYSELDQEGYEKRSEVYVKPFVYAGDNLEIKLHLDKINFGSRVDSADSYTIQVEAEILNGDLNKNYRFEGNNIVGIIKQVVNGKVSDIKATITKRLVSFSVRPDFDANISKVYDGNTFIEINQSLSSSDYISSGVLPKDKDKIKLEMRGNAEFESQYAGPKIPIILRHAILVDKDDPNAEINYEIENGGKIEGLYGSIKPRPVDIADDQIIIYNTRYFGPDANNYNVEVIDDKVYGGDKDNTVSIYMPIKSRTMDNGILPFDEQFKLKVYIDMGLEDNITGLAQNIILKAKPGKPAPEIKLVPNGIDTEIARKVANSYTINNIDKIFKNNKLVVGANSTHDSKYYSKVFIQKFIITEDLIYFDETNNIFNKVYDGTTNLNSRVKAKVGKFDSDGNDLMPFLTKQINGILVLNPENIYDTANAGVHKINIQLSNELIMELGQNTLADWYELRIPEFIEKESVIEKRIINVYIKPAGGKIYDGTKNAVYGIDYIFEMPLASTGKLEGIMPKDEKNIKILCDAEYTSPYAGVTSLMCKNLRFDTTFGDGKTYRNYDIRIAYKTPNGIVQTNEREYPDLTIGQRTLVVTPNKLVLTFGDMLPMTTDINKLIGKPNFEGFVGSDKEDQAFIDSIVYGYDKNTVGSILNVNNYRDIKIISCDETKLANYKLVFAPGVIEVNPLQIIISLDTSQIMIDKYLSSFFGEKLNAVENAIILSFADGSRVPALDAKKIMRYISIEKPNINSDAGKYSLRVIVNRLEGYLNYSFNDAEFNSKDYKYEIKPIDIPYNAMPQDNVFEFEVGRNYADILINRCVLNVNDTSYARFKKTLCKKNSQGVYEPFTGNFEIHNYGDEFAILITSEKYYVDKGWDKNVNYNDTLVKIANVNIVNKSISLAMKDCVNLVFNNAVQKYPETYAGIPTQYVDFIKLVILDSNGNVVNEVINVGTYTVLAYSTNDAYVIRSLNNFDTSIIKDANIKAYAEKGCATAVMRVNKIKVNNVGKNYINISPIAKNDSAGLAELKTNIIKSIKFNADALTEANIKLDVLDVDVAGVYNFKISLTGLDANGIDTENYILDNPNYTVRVITSEKYNEGKVSINTTDNNDLRQEIVNSTLFYQIGNENDIKAMLKANGSLFGNIYGMVYAQFKEDDETHATINSKNVALNTSVIIEIKVDGKFKNKDLYLVTDNGVCKQIQNVEYIQKNGETYAKFVTDDLGWFVYADAPVTKDTVKSIVLITVLSVIMALVVTLFVIKMIKISKATKNK